MLVLQLDRLGDARRARQQQEARRHLEHKFLLTNRLPAFQQRPVLGGGDARLGTPAIVLVLLDQHLFFRAQANHQMAAALDEPRHEFLVSALRSLPVAGRLHPAVGFLVGPFEDPAFAIVFVTHAVNDQRIDHEILAGGDGFAITLRRERRVQIQVIEIEHVGVVECPPALGVDDANPALGTDEAAGKLEGAECLARSRRASEGDEHAGLFADGSAELNAHAGACQSISR